MARPPAASDSGEHSLDSIVQRGGGRAPRRRRDSGDRISFDSIARLVQPSMPPRTYDSLTPVSEADLSPPAVPGADRAARPRRRSSGLAFKIASAIAAVALGAGLSWALRTDPSAQADHSTAGGVPTPASTTAGGVPTPASTAAAASAEAAEPGSGPVVELEPQVLPAEEDEGRGETTPDLSADVDDERRADRDDRERRSDRDRDRADRREERVAAEARERRSDAREAQAEAAEPSASPAEPAVEEPTVAETTEPAEEAPSAELPVQPTREQVQATMAGVLPALRECARGQSGTVQVEVTAGSSGRVRNALVRGAFAGTPEGSCMARAVRGARFPRFSQESFTVRYPFRL